MGYGWSMFAGPETKNAYFLGMNSQGVIPFDCNNRYTAFPVHLGYNPDSPSQILLS